MNPFDYVNSINFTKKDIMEDEKSYVPFIVNKALSYFPDTILYSNEMNRRHSLDNKLQYHYFLNTIRPKKRFSKWAKKEDSDNLEIVKRFYDYNNQKAEQALSILTPSQLQIIRKKLSEGGNNNDRHTT